MKPLPVISPVYSLAKRKSVQRIRPVRSAIANLPSEIQVSILGSKVMFESHDQWFKHFKTLVTTPYPDPEDSDDTRCHQNPMGKLSSRRQHMKNFSFHYQAISSHCPKTPEKRKP
ncbi:hypothetical protein SO802_014771 [Lithocarpus litseifolius]|uniref:Uncharacterized protein n=1 Tax=Lithocarpus litseifolius TaxID=425828 RepID=A0AAW2CRW1_9ROSI